MKLCTIDDCENKHYGKGLCNKHYQRVKFHGSPYADSRHITGRRKDPLYTIWHDIKRRCTDEKRLAYKNYGARGITMYPAWLTDFHAFKDYIGPRPSQSHSIDRIDNNGNYEPGNLRWATAHEQARNKRVSHTVPGISMYVKHYRKTTCVYWHAALRVDGKLVYQKHYKEYQDAVDGRRAAELQYLGKYLTHN